MSCCRIPVVCGSYARIYPLSRSRTIGYYNHRWRNLLPRGISHRQYVKSHGNPDVDGGRSSWMESFKDLMTFSPCTHEIRDLHGMISSGSSLDEPVCLHGYLATRHDLSKKLSFAQLQSRDLCHNIQVISAATLPEGSSNAAHIKLKDVTAHSPVVVKGFLKKRKAPKSNTLGGLKIIQDVELDLREIQVLNEFPNDILTEEGTNYAPEQRHLQLRMVKNARDPIRFRSKVIQHCRSWFDQQDFLEIETPLLFKSTPEGAREFLVPTRKQGMAYALPQSPQQYKQILMASGIPRYFQVAKCFRDEDLRADRQPEFTQLDLEMSFATGEDVTRIIETFIRSLVSSGLWPDADELPEQFLRLTYDEAMSKYGSDKPDLRLGMEIQNVTHLLPADLISKITPLSSPIIEAIKVPLSESQSSTSSAARSFISTFMSSTGSQPCITNPHGAPGIFVFDPRLPLSGLSALGFEAAEVIESDLSLEENDVLILQARPNTAFAGGSTPLGNLRLALHRAAVEQDLLPAPTGFKFLWITDFPLFSPVADTSADPGQGGTSGLCSTHHPFTSPLSRADVDLLSTRPLEARAAHYDIVVNGVELGGGSRRIHNAQMQEYILRDILKMPPSRVEHFRHLIEVLRAGCPPHAGIALGVDRLVAVMLGRESIRDVIAFPKNGSGEDTLVGSPSPMVESQLDTYHLRVKE